MHKLTAFLLIAAFVAPALAQDRQFLSKAEVEAIAKGKKWNHLRTADKNSVRWDMRDNGYLFANNLTTNGSDTGKWSVNDKGQLCVEWRGRSANRCIGVIKNGDKFTMVDAQVPGGSYAELTVE